MNKENLLKWIDMRITEHKEKVNAIYSRYNDEAPPKFIGHDRTEYDYHTGARSELIFLKQCILEHKAFDLPQGVESNESNHLVRRTAAVGGLNGIHRRTT